MSLQHLLLYLYSTQYTLPRTTTVTSTQYLFVCCFVLYRSFFIDNKSSLPSSLVPFFSPYFAFVFGSCTQRSNKFFQTHKFNIFSIIYYCCGRFAACCFHASSLGKTVEGTTVEEQKPTGYTTQYQLTLAYILVGFFLKHQIPIII